MICDFLIGTIVGLYPVHRIFCANKKSGEVITHCLHKQSQQEEDEKEDPSYDIMNSQYCVSDGSNKKRLSLLAALSSHVNSIEYELN